MNLPNVADWIARLEAASYFEEVGDSILLRARISAEKVKTPSAFVVISGQGFRREVITPPSLYTSEVSVAVLYVIQNFTADASGGDTGLDAATSAARQQLIDWQPTGAITGVMLDEQAESTRIAALDSNIVIWQDNFILQHQLQFS